MGPLRSPRWPRRRGGSGARVSSTKPQASARVSLEWAPDALYVAATIADATTEGDSPLIFRNGGPLAPGRPLWFDAMLSGVVGPSGETAYVIWAMTPHASCPKCNPPCDCQSTPAFDTLQFAPITLE